MVLHQREFEQITARLAAEDEPRLWIHLAGDDGVGKRILAEQVATHCRDDVLLLDFDFTIPAFRQHFSLTRLIDYLVVRYPQAWQQMLCALTPLQRRMVEQYASAEPRQNRYTIANWEAKLLQHVLTQLARDQRLVWVLHGLPEDDTETVQLLRLLDGLPQCRQLVISSGQRAVTARPQWNLLNISLKKLSIRETEQLLVQQLGMKDITARLITNYVHIKSDGNERKIRCMVKAFYQSLFLQDPLALVSSGELQKIRSSSSLETIFAALLAQLGTAETQLLAFMSRLEDPLPEAVFLDIAADLGVGEIAVTMLLENHLLYRGDFFGAVHFIVDWQDWQNHLRHHTAVKQTRKALAYFQAKEARQEMLLPYQISDQLFDLGDSTRALNFALREARAFRSSGRPQRALERYAFLRRNLFRNTGKGPSATEVLRESGEMQKQMGLYENAFATFQELRDQLERDYPEDWVYATLQMADVLIEMDAYSEARYLLHDLKIKTFTRPEALALGSLLMGKIERYAGNPAYALRHYEASLQKLDGIADEAFIFRIYETLKIRYLEDGSEDEFRQLVEAISPRLAPGGPYYPLIRMDWSGFLLANQRISEALPEVLRLYRQYRYSGSAFSLQLRLNLAEIYGYYGKWHLSRSQLCRLLGTPLLIPGVVEELRIRFSLGIVEKELAYYGSARKQFELAAQLAAEQGLMRDYQRINAHLGHLYLLVRSFIRSGELLREAYAWAVQNQEEELLLTSALFLASYEMQQGKADLARNYLYAAKASVNLLDDSLDKLNYIYYLVCYHLEEADLDKAGDIIGFWEEQCRGIAKFENLSLWLAGKVYMKQNRLEQAEDRLREAYRRATSYRLPHLRFQIARDLASLSKEQGDTDGLNAAILLAHECFEQLLEAVGDPILRQQLEESREYDLLLRLGVPLQN